MLKLTLRRQKTWINQAVLAVWHTLLGTSQAHYGWWSQLVSYKYSQQCLCPWDKWDITCSFSHFLCVGLSHKYVFYWLWCRWIPQCWCRCARVGCFEGQIHSVSRDSIGNFCKYNQKLWKIWFISNTSTELWSGLCGLTGLMAKLYVNISINKRVDIVYTVCIISVKYTGRLGGSVLNVDSLQWLGL